MLRRLAVLFLRWSRAKRSKPRAFFLGGPEERYAAEFSRVGESGVPALPVMIVFRGSTSRICVAVDRESAENAAIALCDHLNMFQSRESAGKFSAAP